MYTFLSCVTPVSAFILWIWKGDAFIFPIGILTIIFIARTFEKIKVYKNIREIKEYLIENDLLDKLGNIEFWNESNYFLTDNYFIIKFNSDVFCFSYDEIDSIFEEDYVHLGKNSHIETYLHILSNDDEVKVLTYSSLLVNENFRDIKDFLLKKNPDIRISRFC